jgi:hypothetical protein
MHASQAKPWRNEHQTAPMNKEKMEYSFLYWKRTCLMLVAFILMPAAVTAFASLAILPLIWLLAM